MDEFDSNKDTIEMQHRSDIINLGQAKLALKKFLTQVLLFVYLSIRQMSTLLVAIFVYHYMKPVSVDLWKLSSI